MIDVICDNADCPQAGETFHMVGQHTYVVCGGCHAHLEPFNEQPDPEVTFP
jgi:hypothetical protein